MDKTRNMSVTADRYPVLMTKLCPPRISRSNVSRPRLLDKMNVQDYNFSLVCAPAGFGKTTLLVNWLRQRNLPVAWISLDEEDNDPQRFLLYLIAAIQQVNSEFGHIITEALLSNNAPRPLTVLTSVLNELQHLDQTVILALDDYHLIDNPEIHTLIEYLLTHQPLQLRLAMTSRADPPVGLPRLRARRQVIEISERDLRFDNRETGVLLNEIANLGLSDRAINVLETRTEGWVAGLQLAILSLRDESDRDAFIDAFAGNDRYITDYLADEVLQRLPATTRDFLLKVAILDRMCGSLCDCVAGVENSAAMLERLEQDNLFLIPLDNKRHWYRFHHLFADLLRHQISDQETIELAGLHNRASEWFEQNGLIAESVHHAFRANDTELAGNIIERHSKYYFDQGQFSVLLNWYAKLPEEVIRNNPRRMLQYAWVVFVGSGEIVEDIVADVERRLQAGQFTDLDDVKLMMLSAELAFLRGFDALKLRDYDVAIRLVEGAIDLFDRSGNKDMNAPRFHLATAYYATGQLDRSIEYYTGVIEQSFASGYLIVLNGAICGLGRAWHRKGHIHKARQLLLDNMRRLQQHGWDELLVDMTWVHLALAELEIDSNDLASAERSVMRAMQLAENDPCPWQTLLAMAQVCLARIQTIRGQYDIARHTLEMIDSLDVRPALLPLFPALEASVAAIRLRLGELEGVRHWLDHRPLQPQNTYHVEHEEEYMIQARWLIANGELGKGLMVVAAVHEAASQGGRVRTVIEALVLQSMCLGRQGDERLARDLLQQALRLAATQGFVRVFLDEGEPMYTLLCSLEADIEQRNFVSDLMTCFSQVLNAVDPSQSQAIAPDQLSRKELQTLELLAQGLSNRSIAEQLFVSQNTVKTHLKNIYAKLGVSNRANAILMAHRQDLVKNAKTVNDAS